MTRIRTAGIAATLLFAASVAQAASPALREIEQAFIEVGDAIRPIVVNIDVERAVPDGQSAVEMNAPLEEFFRFFGQPAPEEGDGLPQQHLRPRASGSGFIYDSAGHIITNSHVVEDAERIEVTLWNHDKFDAEVIGSDDQTDLAVLRISPGYDLPAARLGDSAALRVGQFAIAVGSPQGLEGSLSFGHVTALGRGQDDNIYLPHIRFFDFIQTDAAINLGNSGGPLCNIDGEVIGINVAIVRWADALGFAIPANTAKKIIPILIAEGKVTRGYLGVHIDDAGQFADAANLPDERGAFVQNVVPDTPAEAGGLKDYDVIRKVNGGDVERASDLQRLVADLMPGDKAVLEVWRDGKPIELTITLGEYPEDERLALLGKDILGLRVQRLTRDLAARLGLDPNTQGVIVASVEPDSPAARAEIRERDVIVEVAKKPVTTPDEFRGVMNENSTPGASIFVRLLRPSSEVDMPIIVSIDVPEDMGE